ncbi:hypothetical protein B0O95_1239 [Mycetohabitans endofungorum]|uniref:Uncharacterized protein n=1 Tax=Mycetohabitans endofungorum TaxID=417203 RepID=A0A2P5K6R7_9BURK|nr:hypothetical protein B0O95_1239 [Mycetohabitans endofungorum]
MRFSSGGKHGLSESEHEAIGPCEDGDRVAQIEYLGFCQAHLVKRVDQPVEQRGGFGSAGTERGEAPAIGACRRVIRDAYLGGPLAAQTAS